MVSTNSRTNQQGDRMSSAAVMEEARSHARSLVRRERLCVGSMPRAHASIASKLGVGPGTLENIVKGRVKRLDSWIRDKLKALLIRELEAEIKRLTHELETARRSGARLDSQQVGEIEAHLAAAKSILNGHVVET
jgi:hypothetical protein